MRTLRNTDVFIETARLPLVNDPALNEEIHAVCPNFHGTSTGSEGLVLHFYPGASAAERETARQIALAHEPQVLSSGQQAAVEKEAARQAVIAEIAMKVNPTPLEAALIAFFELDGRSR